jgi:glycine cleavage system H protein
MSERFYTKSHEWISPADGKAGISLYAQEHLGDIVYVEVTALNRDVKKGDTVGVVESVKATSDIYSPADGKVLEVNPALADQPDLLNKDPYGAGWMFKIQPAGAFAKGDLMDEKDYQAHLKTITE